MSTGSSIAKKFEMSRYIDLDVYHAVERSHPYYIEMIAELVREIGDFVNEKESLRMLEIGAGTGLATEDFCAFENIEITALDLDENCYNILKDRKLPRVKALNENAITFCEPGEFDLSVSVFAHDHIKLELASSFVSNIRNNLKDGGLYLMGGEVLPYYNTMEERIESNYTYHIFIINKALREGNYELAQIEIEALKSGVQMIGDFKRHEALFEEEMLSEKFEMVNKIKLGPKIPGDVGGVFVYVFKAI